MSLSSISHGMRPLRALRYRGLLTFAVSALLGLIIIGLVYNAISILRLPQTGLKLFEIMWVSFTACVVLILIATAIAAGLESLGARLTPKPPGEEWLRNEVRHGRIPGVAVPPLAHRVSRTLDMDRHKGAFEPEDPKEKGNTCLAGQLPHRGEDPLLKAFDTDFPEPGENAEHSGEAETVSLLDRDEQEASRRTG